MFPIIRFVTGQKPFVGLAASLALYSPGSAGFAA